MRSSAEIKRNNSKRRSLRKARARAAQQQQAHRLRLTMRLCKAAVEANNERITDSRDKSRWAHGKYKRAGIYATRPRT